MAIAVEEEKFEAYVRAVAKVGVVSSNEAYHTGSPRGGSIRRRGRDAHGDN